VGCGTGRHLQHLSHTFNFGEEEINRRITEVLRVWNAPEDLAPRIIRSGDIGEILLDP